MYILSIPIFGWYLHVITWHHIGVGLPTRFTVEFCDSGSPRESMWSLGVMVCCQRGKRAATAAFLAKACVRGRARTATAHGKRTQMRQVFRCFPVKELGLIDPDGAFVTRSQNEWGGQSFDIHRAAAWQHRPTVLKMGSSTLELKG